MTPDTLRTLDLLPCPFCGAPGIYVDAEHGMANAMAMCGADCEMLPMSDWHENRVAAAAKWNTRAALSTLPSDGVTIPAGWVLMPDGDPVSLAECSPGPFAIGDNLGFKTEYGAMSGKDVGSGTVEWTVTHWPDAYCLDSGEGFWGGASTREARAALIVQPLAAAPKAPPVAQAEGVEAIREQLRETQAERDFLHHLVTKVGLYCEEEDNMIPLRIEDDSDASVGMEGRWALYLPDGYQVLGPHNTVDEVGRRYTDDDVRQMLRKDMAKVGGLRAWAKMHDIPNSRVSEFETGRRPASLPILVALRLTKAIVALSPSGATEQGEGE